MAAFCVSRQAPEAKTNHASHRKECEGQLVQRLKFSCRLRRKRTQNTTPHHQTPKHPQTKNKHNTTAGPARKSYRSCALIFLAPNRSCSSFQHKAFTAGPSHKKGSAAPERSPCNAFSGEFVSFILSPKTLAKPVSPPRASPVQDNAVNSMIFGHC